MIFGLLIFSSVQLGVAWEQDYDNYAVKVGDEYVWEVRRCRQDNNINNAYLKYGKAPGIELVEGDTLNFTVTGFWNDPYPVEYSFVANSTLQVHNQTYNDVPISWFIIPPFTDTKGYVEHRKEWGEALNLRYFNNSLQNDYYFEEYIWPASPYSGGLPAHLTRKETQLSTGIMTYWYQNYNPFQNETSIPSTYDELEITGITVPPVLERNDSDDISGFEIYLILVSFLIFVLFLRIRDKSRKK